MITDMAIHNVLAFLRNKANYQAIGFIFNKRRGQ